MVSDVLLRLSSVQKADANLPAGTVDRPIQPQPR